MKNVSIGLLLFFTANLVFPIRSNAQDSYEGGFYLLIDWIQSLDAKISQISDHEKKKRLRRKLEYLASDLDNLWISKKDLHLSLVNELEDATKSIKDVYVQIQDRELGDYKGKLNRFKEIFNSINNRINDLKDELSLTVEENSSLMEVIDFLRIYPSAKGLILSNILEVFLHLDDIDEINMLNRKEVIQRLEINMTKALKLTKTARNSVWELRNKIK